MTRGEKNSNPGNIRLSDSKWQGLAPVQDDKDFCVFVSADWGIRAMCVLLIKYYDYDNLDTITGIINKWAPSTENNTASYIADVSRYAVMTPDRKLNLHQYADIAPLVKAIIWHENGEQIYPDTIINQGLARAGILIPKTPLLATKVIQGTAIAAVGASSGIGSTILNNVPALASYTTTSHWLQGVCAVLTSLGIGLSVVGKIRDYGKSITDGGK